MNKHWVIVYVDHQARRFTATARMQKSRLSGVTAWSLANGFSTPSVVARNVPKAHADVLKLREIARYERLGYRYVPRPPLS
jgi:hypothetical protein